MKKNALSKIVIGSQLNSFKTRKCASNSSGNKEVKQGKNIRNVP